MVSDYLATNHSFSWDIMNSCFLPEMVMSPRTWSTNSTSGCSLGQMNQSISSWVSKNLFNFLSWFTYFIIITCPFYNGFSIKNIMVLVLGIVIVWVGLSLNMGCWKHPMRWAKRTATPGKQESLNPSEARAHRRWVCERSEHENFYTCNGTSKKFFTHKIDTKQQHEIAIFFTFEKVLIQV